MSDDYRVDGLSNDKVRAAGKQARRFLGIADADYVEVLDLEGVTEIWTVLGPKPFQFRVAPDADLPRDSGVTSYDGHGILHKFQNVFGATLHLGMAMLNSLSHTNLGMVRFTHATCNKVRQCRDGGLAT